MLFLLGQQGWLRKKELQQVVRWLARHSVADASAVATGTDVVKASAAVGPAFGAAPAQAPVDADAEEDANVRGYFISYVDFLPSTETFPGRAHD